MKGYFCKITATYSATNNLKKDLLKIAEGVNHQFVPEESLRKFQDNLLLKIHCANEANRLCKPITARFNVVKQKGDQATISFCLDTTFSLYMYPIESVFQQ